MEDMAGEDVCECVAAYATSSGVIYVVCMWENVAVTTL